MTLAHLWAGPTAKAEARLKTNKSLITSLSLSTRMLYMNVFIIPLFSYIALFFVLPPALWRRIRALIHRFFAFNGGVLYRRVGLLKTTLRFETTVKRCLGLQHLSFSGTLRKVLP